MYLREPNIGNIKFSNEMKELSKIAKLQNLNRNVSGITSIYNLYSPHLSVLICSPPQLENHMTRSIEQKN